MVGVFMTYIHKIFHVSMVRSLSQPDRKIKINFLDCIVFYSYSTENMHLFGSRNLPFRNERVPVKQPAKRKISSHFSPSRTRRSLRARPVLFPT
jgi:hypothetical protein